LQTIPFAYTCCHRLNIRSGNRTDNELGVRVWEWPNWLIIGHTLSVGTASLFSPSGLFCSEAKEQVKQLVH
jgi:hypothetical protein